MKWLGLVVLWAAAACGESVIVASEVIGGADGSGQCTTESVTAEPAPAVLELLVDTSQTMEDQPPNGRSSKWELTRDALLDAIEAMPEQASIGVVFFPDISNDSRLCFDREVDVPIGVLGAAGSAHRRRIEDAFQAQTPNGGAPTHDAYDFALEQLDMSPVMGRRSMLLITDDYPTFARGCEPENPFVDVDPLIMETGFAWARDVSTFVVGLPRGTDSEQRAQQAKEALSRMAFAGGTGRDGCSPLGPRYCHFDIADEQEFSAGMERTLGNITADALNCSYVVPSVSGGTSPDPEQLQVSFRPEGGPSEELDRRSAGPCNEGWRYSGDGARVVLCESTCDRVREDKGRIELRTGCSTAAP